MRPRLTYSSIIFIHQSKETQSVVYDAILEKKLIIRAKIRAFLNSSATIVHCQSLSPGPSIGSVAFADIVPWLRPGLFRLATAGAVCIFPPPAPWRTNAYFRILWSFRTVLAGYAPPSQSSIRRSVLIHTSSLNLFILSTFYHGSHGGDDARGRQADVPKAR